jgi:hypothetical protein
MTKRPVVMAVAALAGMAMFVPDAAEAHGRGGFHGPVVVVGGGFYHGFYGYPYFGWGYPFYGPYGFGTGGGIDPNVAMIAGLGAIEVNAKPGQAELWVDGRYYGEARDFDGYPSYLWLPEGNHHVALYRGGYALAEDDIEVHRGLKVEMKVKMEKGEAQPPGQKPGEVKQKEAK